MKTNPTSWLGAAAALLLTFAVQPAQAALVLYNPGDLILAFRASGGQGQAESILVNLGPASTFNTAAPTDVIQLSLGDLGADLSLHFGSNWHERTDLTWAVFGSNTTDIPSATLYASRAQTTFGVDAAAWPGLTNASNRTTTRNAIISVATAFDSLEALANSPVAAKQTNSAGAESYAAQVSGSTDFGGVSQWTNIEGNFGVGSEALNLFRVGSTTANLGKFTITNAGVVSFNGTAVDIGAVPEPSKAILALVGMGAILMRRRRAAL